MTNKIIRHLSELAIIVLGITISLFFDELAEDFKRDKQEKYYLQSLLGNLNEDSVRLEYAIRFIKQINTSSDLILKECLENQSINLKSAELANSQTDLLRHTIFTSNTSVFDELKSTGSFIAVKDKTLKNKIFSYYGAIENARADDRSADDVITQFVYPRLNDNLPLSRLVEIPEAEYSVLFSKVDKEKAIQQLNIPIKNMNTSDLVNAIAIRKGINMAQKGNYTSLYEKNRELKEMIQLQIKK